MSTLANFVYERTVDYIRNSARNNKIRDEYDRYMSAQNYNNNEVNKLIDVIIILAEEALRTARSRDEESRVIMDVIEGVVTSNVGAFTLSSRALSDSLPNDIYRDIQGAESNWRRYCEAAAGMARGGSQRPPYATSNQVRDVFTSRGTAPVFGQSSSVFDKSPGEAAPARSIWDQPAVNPQREERAEVNQSQWPSRNAEPAPTANNRTVQTERSDGPDRTKERPFDDFWLEGENWQLAHRSNWTWSYSIKQQTRRTYDPENEVCFLVKDSTGHVREEFLPVTEDLVEASHEIRLSARPNSRIVNDRVEGDVFAIGEDIDAVDLDVIAKTAAYVRKQHIEDLEVGQPTIISDPQTISTIQEAALRVAGEAVRKSSDVVAVNNYVPVPMAADAETLKAMESIRLCSGSDSDLQILSKRLFSLRGVMAENVMNFIDRHYTDEVNAALRDQFGLNITIDSFVTEFEDLLNCGTFKKLGASAVSQFLSRTRALLGSLHFVTDSNDRDELIDAMDVLPVEEDDPEAYAEFRKSVVVTFKPMAMMHVKMDSDKFGMVGKEVRTPQRQGQNADVTMATALTSLYHIGRKTSGGGHVYVVTADNILFELVPISGARDIVGIRLV